MSEKSVAEPAELVGEESQVASRHRSCAISCAVKDAAEEVEVEVLTKEDQSSALVVAAWRVDVERSQVHAQAARGVDEKRPEPCAEAVRVEVDRQVDIDGVNIKRPQPRAEAARVDVERRVDIDGVDVKRPQSRAEAARVDVERRVDGDDVEERPQPRTEGARVDVERQADTIRGGEEPGKKYRGGAPSRDGRCIDEGE